MMLFPRVYDRGHAQMYNTWMGRAADDMSQPTSGTTSPTSSTTS